MIHDQTWFLNGLPAKTANTFSTAIEPIKSIALSVWPPICAVNKVLFAKSEASSGDCPPDTSLEMLSAAKNAIFPERNSSARADSSTQFARAVLIII